MEWWGGCLSTWGGLMRILLALLLLITTNCYGAVINNSNDTVKITDGTDTQAINSDGSTNVRLTDGTDTASIDSNGNLGFVPYCSNGTEGSMIVDCQSQKTVTVTGTRSLKVDSPVRLVGTAFIGTTKRLWWHCELCL